MNPGDDLSETQSHDPGLAEALACALALRESGDFDEAAFRREFPEHADEVLEKLAFLGALDLEGRAAPIAPTPEPTTEPAASSEPLRFGDYETIEELGRGGQGIVYLARDLRLQRKVAVKVLTAVGASSAFVRQRFRREAEAASKLDHPGICPIYETGEVDGCPFIAMRFIDGEPLSNTVSEAKGAADPAGASGPSTRDDFVEIVALVERTARAMHAAHEAGLIHRDIKPANIMVSPTGDPIILDFGLARDLDSDQPTLTQSGQMMGTPAYMSPEQVGARKTGIDARTDVYSLGVTLYECLTLRRPFHGATLEQLYKQILSEEPPDPRRSNPRLPFELKVILETALEKNPDRRYQTAEAFAEDLRRWREHEPILARPVRPLRRAAKWARRHPAKATALVALVISLPIITWFTVQWRMNRDKVLEAEAQRTRQRVETLLGDAYLEFRQGSVEAAIAAFRAVLDLEPGSPEAVAGLALLHVKENRPEDALAVLDRHGTEERHPDVRRVRAYALYRAGRTAEADEIRARIRPPSTAAGHFLAAIEAAPSPTTAGPEALRRARDHLISATLHAPSRTLYLLERLFASGRLGDEVDVRRVVSAVTTRWPDPPNVWFVTGYAFYSIQAYDEAIAAYEKTLEIDPDFRGAHHNMGVSLHKTGRLDEAIEAFREAIRRDPDRAGNHLNLARALRDVRELEEAAACCGEAIRLAPEDGAPHVELGFTLLALRRSDRAVDALREAVRVDPDFAAGYDHLGGTLARLKRFDEALAVFREAVRRTPGRAQTHYNLGVSLADTGRVDEAIAAYEKALRCDPGYVDAHRNLGRIYERRRLYDRALACFREAVRLRPNGPQYHFDLGNFFDRRGRGDEAIASFREVLRINPKHAGSHFNIALILNDRKEYDEAIREFRECLRLNPNDAPALCSIGVALQRKGDLAEGLRMLRRGHAVGSKRRGWRSPSDAWVENCERQALRAFRAAAVEALDGDDVAGEEALELLRAIIEPWTESVPASEVDHVRKILRGFARNATCRRLRSEDFSSGLPETERKAWREAWAAADAALARLP